MIRAIRRIAIILMVVSLMMLAGSPTVLIDRGISITEVGSGAITITVGTKAYAAGTADYTCDGTADDVQLQAALDALPVAGGKVLVLAGTYSLNNAVARAINNITIEGIGIATIFNRDGANPIFSAGVQSNWVFKDFMTDAGGIDVATATNWAKINLYEPTHVAYQVDGDKTVWEDVRTPVTALKLDGTKPPVWTSYKGGEVLAFEDQAVNYQVMYWIWQMPHDYYIGSDVLAHIHTAPEDATAGNVYWELTYAVANLDSDFPVVATSIFTTQPMPGVADRMNLHQLGTMPGGLFNDLSSMIICSLARRSDNAADTFTGKDVYMLEVDLHYKVDSYGSRTETVK